MKKPTKLMGDANFNDWVKENLSTVELEKHLYKPISEFNWKDASRSELNKEVISHYSKLFAL